MKRVLYITLSLFFFFHCSSQTMNFSDMDVKNKDISGRYKNTELTIVRLLDRKVLKDTLDYTYFVSHFDITKDKHHIYFSLYQTNGKVVHRKYKYKERKGVYQLKNHNFKPLLVPYVFGAIDIRKLYLYRNIKGNLKIGNYEHRSGAMFIVGFLDGKSTYNMLEFEKIEN